MNYTSENNSQTSFSLESLVQKNSQSLEIMEQTPYQPLVYAIPEQQWEEWMKLLKQAAEFQPTLYKLIFALTTRAEMQEKLDEVKEAEKAVLQNLLTANKTMETELRKSTIQAGKDREESMSKISALVEKNRSEIQELVSSTRRSIQKLLAWTALASILLSVLVCVAWQHWVI